MLFYQLDERGQTHVILRAHASHFDPQVTESAVILRNLSTLNRKM
jgi:hypothetical protein